MLGSSGGGMPGSSSEGGSSAHGDGGGTETVGTTSIMSGGTGNDEKGHGSGDYFEGDRSTGGNRWPRQETIALLKIRSDMDAVFRDSSLKGPLWDEISRKMAELGYHRSAKKCKEKFENVYKYHKRTKDGRVGKSEGKTYRFFDQLEAFDQHHSSSSPHPPPSTPRVEPAVQAAVPVTMVIPVGTNLPPGVVTVTSSPIQYQVNLAPMSQPQQKQQQQQQQQQQPYHHQFTTVHHASAVEMENGSSPSATPSSSSSTSSDEELIGRRKRKRKWKGFFEKMMNEVISKQEEMQKRFLEVVEKREHDRLVREETWKAQEMDRLNKKHEILIRERSMVAAKDAALIEILKKISDQHNIDLPLSVQTEIQTQVHGTVPVPIPIVTGTGTVTQTPPQPQGVPQVHVHENIVSFAPVVPIQAPPQPQPQPQPIVAIQTPPQPQPRVTQVHVHENIVTVTPSVPIQAPPQPQVLAQTPPHLVQQPALVVAKTTSTSKGGDNELQPSSSRWPKAEIDALINLRSKLDQKYQEGGPKGPLWEEISSSMKHLGYNRNAKRCKEKWENINKYYKKVKESNKKRPEDSKTCPYFDQLDALYREKTTTKMDINTTITPNIPTYNNNPPTNNNAPIFKLIKPDNTTSPILARPEQQWPPGQDHRMEDAGSENDSDDEGDEDDDEQGSGGYEIVANTSNNNGGNSMNTASTNNKATQV